ncbi:MAG: hypothetical protein PUG60_05535 [Lachnospiraceae bacterium]|nr:hypothetical protein [Lachnospiraceae bacterium]MDY4970931.1 hypothetical protein [Lachnospiraceae bacterium]
MESQYYEHLVHCKTPLSVQLLRVVSVVGFVFSFVLMATSAIIGLIGCVLMGVLFWYSNQEAGKEYEYIYVDGDISFDAIYQKSRRKNKGKTSWEETKLVCRAGAPELEGYRQKNAKVQSFTGKGKNEDGVYALVTEAGGTPVITYFEPAQEMLEMMWRKSPSKVKR